MVRKVLLKSIIFLVLLVSSGYGTYIMQYVDATSGSVTVTATNSVDNTVLHVMNNADSTSDVTSFILQLNGGGLFKSYILDSGWIGKKTSPNTLTFSSLNPLKPGDTINFQVRTDNENPSMVWKAFDSNSLVLGSGIIGNQNPVGSKPTQLPTQQPSQSPAQQTTRGILDASTFRIIPSTPAPGFDIRVVGLGFSSKTSLDLFAGTEKITTLSSNGNGNFVVTTKIPNTIQPGSVNFILKDQQGNQRTFTTNIKPTPQRTNTAQNIPLTVNIDPIYHRGDPQVISGTASPGSTLTISLADSNGSTITTFPSHAVMNGTFSVQNIIPIDRDFGKYSITVSDGKNQVSKEYRVVSVHQLSLSTSSQRYDPGDSVIINGSSISNQLVSFTISDAAGHQIFVKDVNVTSDGKIFSLFKLDDAAIKGTYVITAAQGTDSITLYFGVGQDPVPVITATLDRLNYINTDHPILSVSGPPSSTLNLIVVSPSDVQVFADTLQLGGDGLATYSFNLTSYTPGVYSAVLTHAEDKVEKEFSVGLKTDIGAIILKTVKDVYLPGDSIIIIGTGNPNSVLDISLTDPTGLAVKKIQTFTDKTGHFSSFDFRVPPTATPGTWNLVAESGINHKSFPIAVKSATQSISVLLDRNPGIYARGDLVIISGTDAGVTTSVNIDILDANLTKSISLQAGSTNRGDFSTTWPVPKNFVPGSYIIQVSSVKGKASTALIVQ